MTGPSAVARPTGARPAAGWLERRFELRGRGTTVAREAQAGVTTFAAMAYILAVNPAVLSATGMDRAALVTVTAIGSAAGTMLMAVLANYPLAMAPGMGLNSFFAFTIVLGAGVPWRQALGMVFLNGCLFLVLSVTGLRERILRAVPYPLKLAITCGIGLFIAFIGLRSAGVIVASPATIVALGPLTAGPPALCLAGLALTSLLVARRVPGAIVLGVALVTVAGLFVPDGGGGTVTTMPAAFLSLPASPAPVMLQLDLGFLTSRAAFVTALPLVLTLLLVDMFDNIGTLIGVTKRAGFLDARGELPNAGRVLVADSIAAILSGLLGTSAVVSYIESAAGVEAGGRTGLTTITTAACFLLALFLTPLLLAVPAAATAPALVVVGLFMFRAVGEIDLGDVAVAGPAVLTVAAIPLTGSIADGIGLGLLLAAVMAIGTGRPRQLTWTGYAIALVFFARFFAIFPFDR